MSFLDELAAFLESVRAGDVPDLRVSQATMAGHLRELERWFDAESDPQGSTETLRSRYAAWIRRCRTGLLEYLYERAAIQFPEPTQLTRLVGLALASLIEDEHSLSGSVEGPDLDSELGPLRAETLRMVADEAALAFKRYEPRQAPSPRRISRLLGVVRPRDGVLELTAAGSLFLQLGRRDRLRWLLALELASSEEPHERNRLHVQLATRLRERGRVEIDGHQTIWSSVLTQSWEHEHREPLERWAALGVLRYSEVHPYTGEVYVYDAGNPPDEIYELTATGRTLLDDLLSEASHPLRELALAMLTDEDAVLPANFPWSVVGRPANARALVRYSKILTHEVRNVLLPVQVATRQLGKRLDAADLGSAHAHIATMEAGLSRIFDFVDNWRRVMEQAEEPGAPFRIVAAVRDAIAASQHQLERSIELHTGAGVDHAEVFGTRDLMTQVLVELIRNAVQAGGPRVLVTISVDHDGATVSIAISDDGPGVPRGDQERIFRRGVTLRPGGTGQGLADARDIVRDMSGEISAVDGPGGGARFVVTLPSHIRGAS